MKRKRNAFAAILLILALLVTGCGNGASQNAESQGTSAAVNAEGRIVEYASEDLDATWDASSATKIQLNGTTIQVDGKGANASGSTLTITDGGSYVLSGTLTDGQILVEAGDKDTVRLILNGVEITNQDNAVIYSKSSQKTILTLAEGSVNIVADQGEYKLAEGQDDPDATIFSKSDLTINGTGSL